MAGFVSDKSVVIENEQIKKEITLSGKKIESFCLYNKKIGKDIYCKADEELFTVSLKGFLRKKLINASSLRFEKGEISSTAVKSEVTLYFLPFSFMGSKIRIKLIYSLGHNDFFIKKHLEFYLDKKGRKDITLDYIDFYNISTVGKHFWCLPEQKGSHIPGFALSLGQPVYVESFFFGCEFPACLNTVTENKTSVRYYSGKSLSKLIGSEKFTTYDALFGVASGESFAEVQRAFFAYIETISKPVKLRRQYNSWYDNMLNITKENLTSSFTAINEALVKSGEKPLDSFVADDGWNDYEGGFWAFNNKFPEGLKPFSELSESFGSRFGLWLGPRGGYTSDTPKFAKRVEKAGNGYYNRASQDICVASDKYIEKTEKLLTDFIRQYRLNYFKLDGFARMPCKNKKHDHITGGYKNMYFYTEHWEKWLAVFRRLKDVAGGDLFINLTCYAPPSAWFLHWVDSLWMQISDDVGFIGKKKVVSDKDRMLSYRDNCYFDFYRTRQFQFPQSHLYNHDPIYGNEAKVSMTDDEFRSFLYTCACRGTSFWELYYSHSMMNEEKWKINHEVLTFIDENMDTLSHSVIFGQQPTESGGCYGYSAFSERAGVLCLRNSGNQDADFEVTLDEKIGVSKSFFKRPVTHVLYSSPLPEEEYGYGDTVKLTLKAYETVVVKFS